SVTSATPGSRTSRPPSPTPGEEKRTQDEYDRDDHEKDWQQHGKARWLARTGGGAVGSVDRAARRGFHGVDVRPNVLPVRACALVGRSGCKVVVRPREIREADIGHTGRIEVVRRIIRRGRAGDHVPPED